MDPELIVWGEQIKEAYCTLHAAFDPSCASCNWAATIGETTACQCGKFDFKHTHLDGDVIALK